MTGRKTVTIEDVASAAGVAVSTVSRVINNKDRVSPKTRKIVLDKIDELGYKRNDFAASIKTGKRMLIVIVVPDLINEIYTAAVRGVEEIASAKGYHTLIYSASNANAQHSHVFESNVMQLVDGIIWFPSEYDSAFDLSKLDKPVVTIDRDFPTNDGYSVTLDNYDGAYVLTNELINKGHRKVAIIAGKSDFNVTKDRVNGYQAALTRRGITIREDYIRMGDWYEETGYRNTRELLELQDPPTAIFAFNNLICLGCARYLMEHGMIIGKDISLVAFDDWSVAEYLGPGITTIRSPIAKMGRESAKMLISLIEKKHDRSKTKKLVLSVELVKRGSIASI